MESHNQSVAFATNTCGCTAGLAHFTAAHWPELMHTERTQHVRCNTRASSARLRKRYVCGSMPPPLRNTPGTHNSCRPSRTTLSARGTKGLTPVSRTRLKVRYAYGGVSFFSEAANLLSSPQSSGSRKRGAEPSSPSTDSQCRTSHGLVCLFGMRIPDAYRINPAYSAGCPDFTDEWARNLA